MVWGSQNHKSQNTPNQGTPQTPLAKKPPALNNDIPSPSTATSSENRTADHYKLIEKQQKVIAIMQEKIHTLEAKAYELEGWMNMTQTSTVIYKTWSMLRSNTHGGHVLLLMASQNLNTRKVLIILTMQVIDTLERECGISPDVIKNNLDKTHPIGRPDEYGKQLRIVKF